MTCVRGEHVYRIIKLKVKMVVSTSDKFILNSGCNDEYAKSWRSWSRKKVVLLYDATNEWRVCLSCNMYRVNDDMDSLKNNTRMQMKKMSMQLKMLTTDEPWLCKCARSNRIAETSRLCEHCHPTCAMNYTCRLFIFICFFLFISHHSPESVMLSVHYVRSSGH